MVSYATPKIITERVLVGDVQSHSRDIIDIDIDIDSSDPVGSENWVP